MTTTPFALLPATLYGKPRTLAVAHFTCLWPSVFGPRPVHVTLIRDPGAPDGFDLALVSTDLAATPGQLVGRYATRWPVEVSFRDARQDAGVGQARNRTRLAVQRTVPFGLVCFSLAVVWYATCGHHPADLAARRALAPWYQTKAAPSVQDMLAKLRRVLIAAQYQQGQPSAPTVAEILQVQAAWAAAGAELRNSRSDNPRKEVGVPSSPPPPLLGTTVDTRAGPWSITVLPRLLRLLRRAVAARLLPWRSRSSEEHGARSLPSAV